MARIKYVGTREKGMTAHLPYPFTSMSRQKAEVTFTAPGDVQDVDAKYAGDLVTQGGGQFEFVETKKEPKAVEPEPVEPVVEPVEAVEPEPVEPEPVEPKRFGFPKPVEPEPAEPKRFGFPRKR